MFIRRVYHEALGHASYVIGCRKNKKAIVIDPGRMIEPYLQICDDEGLRLEAVAETHIHADYVSGARELWADQGCIWYLSRLEKADLFVQERCVFLQDQDTFLIGDIHFHILHTPGHTPEHICFVVSNSHYSEEVYLFSGDCVFVGDVGRPDLLEKAVGIAGSADVGARQMFQSIKRISQFPDHLQIWPSHGAGSLCGKALGSSPYSTLGEQRKSNWAFQEKNEERFVEKILDSQPDVPGYFSEMKKINAQGAPLLRELNPLLTIRSEGEIADVISAGILVVDARHYEMYSSHFVRGTINIPYGKSFIHWAGWIVDRDKPFWVIVKKEDQDTVIRDLLLIGLDNIRGVMDADALADFNVLCSYRNVTIREVTPLVLTQEVIILDVRQQQEWDQGHIAGAIHIPLGRLRENLHQLPMTGKKIVVYCQAGLRSAIATTVLCSHGYENVMNIQGGYLEWSKQHKT